MMRGLSFSPGECHCLVYFWAKYTSLDGRRGGLLLGALNPDRAFRVQDLGARGPALCLGQDT